MAKTTREQPSTSSPEKDAGEQPVVDTSKVVHAAAQELENMHDQLRKVNLTLETVTKAIVLLENKLVALETRMDTLEPSTSMVPSDVWASVGAQKVLCYAVQGAIAGMLARIPTPQTVARNPKTLKSYVQDAMRIAEACMLEAAIHCPEESST